MARLSPRAPRDCEEFADYSLSVPDAQQHLRASPSDDAQDAADLDHVFAVPDASEADYSDAARVRPRIVRAAGYPARPDLGVLPGIRIAEGRADRDFVEGV